MPKMRVGTARGKRHLLSVEEVCEKEKRREGAALIIWYARKSLRIWIMIQLPHKEFVIYPTQKLFSSFCEGIEPFYLAEF